MISLEECPRASNQVLIVYDQHMPYSITYQNDVKALASKLKISFCYIERGKSNNETFGYINATHYPTTYFKKNSRWERFKIPGAMDKNELMHYLKIIYAKK